MNYEQLHSPSARTEHAAQLHGERNVVEGLTNFVNSLSVRLDT